jgi:proteic killer suppression protein
MNIENFRHKGLRQLYENNTVRGIQPAMVDKLRDMLTTIETAENLDDLTVFPGWRLHPLKGDLKGFWSLTVTGNWRLIFRYDENTNTAYDVDLTDYH